MSANPLEQAARDYLAQGLSVIPLQDNKRPLPGWNWKQFQQQAMSFEHVKHHFSDAAKIGIVTGYNNLECIDFDYDPAYELPFDTWLDTVESQGVDVSKFLIVRTAGGGFHVWYRVDGSVDGNTKLARYPNELVSIETRGSGGYAVAIPSAGYEVIQNPSSGSLATISPTERELLLDIARSLDQTPSAATPTPPTTLTTNPTNPTEHDGVIAQFKREQGLEGFRELLERHGYIPKGHDSTAETFTYLSPKSTSGNPGVKLLYGECADGIVFSWHGNDLLPSERGLDFFEAFAILEHAGDKSAAYRAAKQHLGLWQDTPTARAATSAAVSTSEPPNTPTEPNEPPNAGDFEARRLTEWSNALRLQQFFGDTVAYTPGLGWFVYSEKLGIFEHDDGGHRIRRRATEALQQQLRLELANFVVQSAAASGNARAEFDAIIKSWQKWLKTSASKRCVEASLGFLQDLTIVDPTEWDSNPWLLVVANGALNLKTLELQPHSAKHRATKRSPVRFDANAVHPALESMLELLRRDDREVTLQRALGSCLTGFAPNEKLFYLVGTGGTGKSTLMESVSALLGDYAVTVDPTMLLEQRNGGNTGARPDLLRLRGARLAVAGELPKHGKLDSAQVKALTGRDTISARALYSNVHVDFEPVFKLFVHSNYDVRTEWDDTGIQRRLLRIPFNAKPEKADPKLKTKLKTDATAQSALLLWLLDGLQQWLEHEFDLAESDAIQQAIRDYHRENNPFYEFAEDCLKFTNDLSKQAPAKDLRGAYVQWCDGIGVRPRSSNELGRWLASQGCERQQVKIQGTNTRVWAGVVIKGAFG